MTVFVVTAYDKTAYRLTRAFSTKEKAEQFKKELRLLLWEKITIDAVEVDKGILQEDK